MLKLGHKIMTTCAQIRFTYYRTLIIAPMWPEIRLYASHSKGKSNLLHWLEQKSSDMPVCFHSPAKFCYGLVKTNFIKQ